MSAKTAKAASAGNLTLGGRERVNAAYAQYRTVFDQAPAAAHGNYEAPTPDSVKALANEVIGTISAIPKRLPELNSP